MKIGYLPLGRPTFDVPYAEQKLSEMLKLLIHNQHKFVGSNTLLFDEAATKTAIGELQDAQIDHLIILQVTFTDASMTVAAANAFDCPISIWAVPEPRTGGRLRLNAFCGLNLASHALGLNGRAFSYAYLDPETAPKTLVDQFISGERTSGSLNAETVPATDARGQTIANILKTKRIGRVGERPNGFDTCNYDKAELTALASVDVEEIELNELFDVARNIEAEDAAALRTQLDEKVPNADEVDQEQLDRSLRLKLGLDQLQKERNLSAFALRCWPETFTEYGGAMCGPASLLGEARVPCACEADVYGALTQLLLQAASDTPVFLTDIVDVDVKDNSAVLWHCGQAPLSMRRSNDEPTATVHTNRKQPLLFQFALKPGPVTMIRVSQARGQTKLILSVGEMLDRPMAFTGTSGVVRFSRPATNILEDIMASGLEHHIALAYGDHRDSLLSAAGALNLPVLEI
jgi:L-fucose isomerase-like protein